ncbi:MAG: tRNA-dihydrouridine synthase A [Candidatus Tokpelaia sp. JSC189]|nr:MAG: tRNA-dihydrouridine synthase A [Candidatus Tokpelaia sp. JSC189]
MFKSRSEEKISENYNLSRFKTYRSLGRFSVAPMLDWTDRHCRFFHRQLTESALLYSEMIVADAAICGDRTKILSFSEMEHPVALQLAGSDAGKLAEAARIGADFGYDEINLNVGCPSDHIQSAAFGACLMQEPDTVARAVDAMKKAVLIPVTVKCRIGVDEQDSEAALDEFGEQVLSAGADAIWIHARKVWLKGLSPKENREIPPLDYERVYRFRRKKIHTFIGINGGIQSLDEAVAHLEYVDGVMIGRAAYYNPLLLIDVDRRIYGQKAKKVDYTLLIDQMAAYIDIHVRNGGRASHVTRHMIGLFHGFAGVRGWRQILSTETNSYEATSAVLFKAFEQVVLP